MRVLLHDYGGYGFIAQAARELASRGHEVRHVHNASLRNGKGLLERQAHDPPSLSFGSISSDPDLDRYRVVDRFRLERSYARKLVQATRGWRPDVLVAANTPLLVLQRVKAPLAAAGIPLVNWLQDLHSVAMGDDLIRRAGHVGRVGAAGLERVEAQLLRSCTAVVPVSSDWLPVLQSWGVPPERITVVPNWAEILPLPPRHSSFSAEHDLDDKVTLLYAGTLGLKHEPQQLVELAEAFGGRPDVRVVVVSEGLGRQWLEGERRERGLANLILVDFQPPGRVQEMLGSADVLLSMLRPAAGRYSVPSKVLAYLVAGRAQLGALPPDNLAAQTLVKSGGGLVVEPGRRDDWIEGARRLAADPAWREELGRSGRAYAEANFEVGPAARLLEDVLQAATRQR